MTVHESIDVKVSMLIPLGRRDSFYSLLVIMMTIDILTLLLRIGKVLLRVAVQLLVLPLQEIRPTLLTYRYSRYCISRWLIKGIMQKLVNGPYDHLYAP